MKPFVTHIVTEGDDGQRKLISARHHRKGLRREVEIAEVLLLSRLWQPGTLNWWIGSIFAIGSTLFAIGSIFYLAPELAERCSVGAQGIGIVYFAGSIPFTTAAYLQLYQAANALEYEPIAPQHGSTNKWFGWRPGNIGWTSCALQFAGTLLFNVNTFYGMYAGLNWLQEDLAVWVPDMVGSVLFLASGYLAVLESNHRFFTWNPTALSWWITFANFLGCVAFMISAVYAFTSPAIDGFGDMTVAVVFTLVGASGFLIGSLLMLAESS